ncbi:sensor histidine kinase [Paenibacillus arenilitoris]|uniref:Histidine kinase n=1 Tax=Paenibacillus arenilitoris TaxID=2772299 RepID=A0A927H4G4_9BACL|nr:histidine kinase [Paenibacillus arenilitoris]MBD2867875.1 histidine kinase [Paenibacillus arenilitoris]
MKRIIRSNLHVYQKVIIVFMAMMIPVYLINLWMNVSGLTFMKKGFANTSLSSAAFYSSQLDDQIAFVRKQQLHLMNDSDLQKLSFLGEELDGFEDFQLVNRIRERLVTIQDSSDYLVDVGTYIKSLGRTISTKNGVEEIAKNSQFSITPSYSPAQPAQPYYYDDGRLYFIESGNNGNILVYMELSVPQLVETLSHLIAFYEDSGALLANDGFEHVISAKADDPVEQMKAIHAKHEPGRTMDLHRMKIGNHDYMVTSSNIRTLGLTLYTYMSEREVTEPLKKFNVLFILFSCVSLAIVIMFSFSVNLMIHKPLKKLIRAFKKLETDNLIASHGNRQLDNEFGYLYRNFDQMVDKLRQSINENYEQKIALQHSELKQLQSQINPHFLYNSFFNLYMICRSGDMEGSATLAQKLGGYYQFITRSGKDTVALEEEYRHALDYCEIQSIRFSNRIQVEASELPESVKAVEVPRIIVQPLVENAFEHAFENGMRRGHVRLEAAFQDNYLTIVVEDDGSALTEDSLLKLRNKLDNASHIPEKTGLVNVCRRIQLQFGDRSGISVSRSEMGGLKAEIGIYFDEKGSDGHVPIIDR